VNAATVAAALRARRSFILTSHARPDGDAVGSQLALAFALEALGKSVRLIDRDPVPTPYAGFPGVKRVEVTTETTATADAVVYLECSGRSRPEVSGLDSLFAINVDHHAGNEMYGDVNWFDGTAAACGEMVADIIDALGVPWSRDIAEHLYLAVATDTGCFRYGPLSARTFEVARRIALAGVDTAALSRIIFDSYGIGRVRLTGVLLSAMELHHGNQLAVLEFDDALLAACGATIDDTEGLVNLPLGARDVVAVVLLKAQGGDRYRVSLRSKGAVDVRMVAANWNGGGHQNAAGCSIAGPIADVKRQLVNAVGQAISGVTDAVT
jgi:phosphoesterase RecJ-like protein